MRKVLSFVLVLSLVLGSFSFAFAGTTASDIAGKDCEDAVNVLTDLEVVKGYPDGTYKPENIVTRAEMAVIVINALGLKDYAVGKSNFKDMAGYDWAQGAVAYAQSLGIINGYPDGTFKPGKTVSYNEAATMLVGALGYNKDSLVGTWPANYVSKAQTLGILDDVVASVAGANRGDIALMTYQTLNCAMGKTNKDGDWVAYNLGTIAAPVDDTMLNRLGATQYDPAVGVAGDPFVLTYALASTAVIDIYDYVGAYVSAYVNDDDEIIAIKEVKSTFLTGEVTLTAGKITEIEVGDVEYTVNAADTYMGPVSGAPAIASVLFANGLDGGAGYGIATGDDVTIAAKVSGKTVSGVYSILDWNVSQNKKVKSSDLKSITASTPKLLSETFVLNDDKEIDENAFQLKGVAKLSDIKEDNVVYVYKSIKGIAKVEVGTTVVKGEVTKATTGATPKYTVAGKAYELWAGFAGTAPKVGDTIEAYLDFDGNIYSFEITEGVADDYAVVLRTSVASEVQTALNADDAELELFLADGTKKTFKIDYDEIGGANIKAGTVAANPLNVYDKKNTPNAKNASDDVWNIGTGDIIQYDVNGDGEINAINWIVDAAAGPALTAKLAGSVAAGAAAKVSETGTYNGLKIADDAVIFAYDYNAGFDTDEDYYAVGKKSEFLDTTLTAATAYFVEDGVIEFIYLEDSVAATNKTYGVLLSAATASTTTPKYEATMLVDGVEKTYAVKANITAYAKVGTMYQLDFSADGKVLNDLLNANTAKKYFYAATSKLATDVLDVSGNVITTNVAGVGGAATTFLVRTPAGALTEPSSLTVTDNVIVYVLNDDGTEYELGTTSDIDGASLVTFYDVIDEDKVFDMVLVGTPAVDLAAPTVATQFHAAGVLVGNVPATNGTYTLVFSEAINAASQVTVKAAVDAAITEAGAGTVASAWNVAGTTLTVTIAGCALTPADDVTIAAIANQIVTDLAGNTSVALDVQL